MYCNVDSIPDNIICQRDAMDCFSTQLSRIIGIANGDTTLVGMERIRDIIEKMYSKICYKTLRSSGVEIELYHFFMIAVAEKFGFTATHIDASSIKKCIDDKVAVIVPINVETTTGSVGAHQVQITGYQNESLNFSVSDPKFKTQNRYLESELTNVNNINAEFLYSLKKK